jgi:cbb3-type cytochrome oxidase maturation protein
MMAIFFLIGCSVLVALFFLIAFFWANKSGQHDDTYTPAIRMLFDDELITTDQQDDENTKPNHTEKTERPLPAKAPKY